jgi:hypothetical protein
MIFILVLQGTLGLAAVGHFDDLEACKRGADKYMEMLDEQKSDDQHPVQLFCVGVPQKLPQPVGETDA